MRRSGGVAVMAAVLTARAGVSWVHDVEKWRADYETKLTAPAGWLSVAGLFWLHTGANTVGSDPQSEVVLPQGTPAHAGILRREADAVFFEPASGTRTVMKPDDPGPPDVVTIGDVSMTVINRGDKLGVRLRNPNAETRRNFSGSRWYPIREAWRVNARWVAYPQPKKIPIANILGMVQPESSPGYAEFTLKGVKLRLEPIMEDDHLFFIFKDLTAGRTTYGAGRFLYAALPSGGRVELDFNKAENPPCAFTAFATCPLPPKQNSLAVAIEAGEKAAGAKKYGNH